MIRCHLVARVSPLTLVIVDSSPKLRSMIAPTASPGVRWWWEIGNPHLQNKACVCLASIWGGSWRPLWNSHAYLVFQVHPYVSDLQGGHEGELLEIEKKEIFINRTQVFEKIFTELKILIFLDYKPLPLQSLLFVTSNFQSLISSLPRIFVMFPSQEHPHRDGAVFRSVYPRWKDFDLLTFKQSSA